MSNLFEISHDESSLNNFNADFNENTGRYKTFIEDTVAIVQYPSAKP